jgi:hypothetical protein
MMSSEARCKVVPVDPEILTEGAGLDPMVSLTAEVVITAEGPTYPSDSLGI